MVFDSFLKSDGIPGELKESRQKKMKYRLFAVALLILAVSACSNREEDSASEKKAAAVSSEREESASAPPEAPPPPGSEPVLPESSAPEEAMPYVESAHFTTPEPFTPQGIEAMPPPESEQPTTGLSDAAESPVTHETVTPDISQPDLDDYRATLEVTEKIDADKTGNMRVWIGASKNVPSYDTKTTVRDSISFPANIGQYGRITPLAPDFDVNPEKSGCILIHPSGSSEDFTITPRKRGVFHVSAKIELYKREDCLGIPVPKTTQIMSVSVVVDKKFFIWQLFDIFWDKFLVFWGALLALLFLAVITFIKRKTKMEDEKQ